MKRPKDMTSDERMELREVARTDPAIMRATWYEDDDVIDFGDDQGRIWRLHQTAGKEWVRVRAA